MKYWYVSYFFEKVVTFASFEDACRRMDILRKRGIKAVLSNEKFVLCDNCFPMTAAHMEEIKKREKSLEYKDWRDLL